MSNFTWVAEVAYIQKYKLVQVIWKNNSISSQEYREAFNIALKTIEDNPIVYFISDTKKQDIVSPADRKWFQKHIIPKAIKAGLLRGAVVISSNPFKKYYMNLIIKITNTFKLPLKLFSDYNSALEWCISFNEHK